MFHCNAPFMSFNLFLFDLKSKKKWLEFNQTTPTVQDDRFAWRIRDQTDNLLQSAQTR